MYKSPIEIIYGQMQTQMEGDILRAVQNYGINVDKEELIRALQYDRDQYHKGFRDGTPKWIPVSEAIPEQYQSVIGWTRFKEMGEVMHDGKQFVWVDEESVPAFVTHWMPFPEPPEGGEKDA
jgi:hypothetical protein